MTAALRQVTRPMPRNVAGHVADLAKSALLAELETWPKPGLVSHVDSGSHADMDANTFEASAAAITPFYDQLDHRRCLRIQYEQVARDWTGGGARDAGGDRWC